VVTYVKVLHFVWMFAFVFYDRPTIMTRYTVFMCDQKLMNTDLNLLHGTKQKRVMKKLKNKKTKCSKKQCSNKVRGVSPDASRESVVGKR